MGATVEMAAWVGRVLAVDLPQGGGTPRADGAEAAARAMAIWTAAKDTVDAQISALQREFRATQIPLGIAVADVGLPGFTKNTLARFAAALFDLRGAGDADRPKAAEAVRRRGAELGAAVAGHKGIAHLAKNPWGLPVTIGPTLTEALERIQQVLTGV